MRYLTIFPLNLYIDLKCVDRVLVSDCLKYAYNHDARGVISNYRDIMNAPFQRRQESGELLLSEIPRKLEGEELIEYLEALLYRGKDKAKRSMHPNSLSNLRPRRPFSTTDRPNKKPKLSNDQLIQAKLLRDAGASWKAVGDRLVVNAETVRSALRRSESQIQGKNSSQKQGK